MAKLGVFVLALGSLVAAATNPNEPIVGAGLGVFTTTSNTDHSTPDVAPLFRRAYHERRDTLTVGSPGTFEVIILTSSKFLTSYSSLLFLSMLNVQPGQRDTHKELQTRRACLRNGRTL